MRAPVLAWLAQPGIPMGRGPGARAPPPPGRGAALGEGAQPRRPGRWRPLRGGRCGAAGPGARRGRIFHARRGGRSNSRLATSAPPKSATSPLQNRAGAAQNAARIAGGAEREGGRAGRGAGGTGDGMGVGVRWGERSRRRLPAFVRVGHRAAHPPTSGLPARVRSGQAHILRTFPTTLVDEGAASGPPWSPGSPSHEGIYSISKHEL